jgi:repressor LexA
MRPGGGASKAVLSTEQQSFAEATRDWPDVHKLPPTLDELAECLGLAKSTIHLYRKRLRDLGLVRFDEGRSRSTRIATDPGVLAAYGLRPAVAQPPAVGPVPTPGRVPRSRQARLGGAHAVQHAAGASGVAASKVWALPLRPPRTLPVAGRIAAGLGRPSDPVEDAVEVEDGLVGPGRYALRVTGDSLVDLGIYDGDQVIIDSDQPFHEGDVVAALLPHGGATRSWPPSNSTSAATAGRG